MPYLRLFSKLSSDFAHAADFSGAAICRYFCTMSNFAEEQGLEDGFIAVAKAVLRQDVFLAIMKESNRRARVLKHASAALALVGKSSRPPLGAAFSHARASGKKQDHESRRRRANAYLRSKGHETMQPMKKMAPNAGDVRAEQFLKLVRDRKKKKSDVKKTERIAVSVPSRIVKAEQQDWQRLVWSVVYEPDSIDLHGDFMDADTIQKAAHDAMRSGIYVNSEHRGDPLDAEVVESYTAPCDFTLTTGDGDVTVTKGSWVQCLHVKDDEHWQGVLDGTYTGFSLEGMALAQAV